MQKSKEYDVFKKENKLHLVDMDTLVSEQDRVRFMDRMPEYRQMINETQFEDPLIRLNHNLSGLMMKPLEDKYNIKKSELLPQLSQRSLA